MQQIHYNNNMQKLHDIINYTTPILLYIHFKKQYKTSNSLTIVFLIFQIFSLRTRSHLRRITIIIRIIENWNKYTPDGDYSFSVNLQWTWKYSIYYWGMNIFDNSRINSMIYKLIINKKIINHNQYEIYIRLDIPFSSLNI